MDHLNDTKQMLWERPTCQGLEGHLKDCSNWQARQLGAGVCGECLCLHIFYCVLVSVYIVSDSLRSGLNFTQAAMKSSYRGHCSYFHFISCHQDTTYKLRYFTGLVYVQILVCVSDNMRHF